MDLAQTVTTEKSYKWEEGTWQLERDIPSPKSGRYRVVAYDFGVKRNISAIA